MKSVEKFAKSGGLVLGICNGFQILLRGGIAAGCDDAQCRIALHLQARAHSRGTDGHAVHLRGASPGRFCTIPIAHSDGNYICDEATLAELETQSADSVPLHDGRWQG